MNMMDEYTSLDFEDVRKSFTKQTREVFDEVKEISKHNQLSKQDINKIEQLFNPEQLESKFIAKNLALNEENVKYVKKVKDTLLKSNIYNKKKLLTNVEEVIDTNKIFKRILEDEPW